MSRNKLITIRIEESKRNNFRKWTKNNKVDGATFLYKVIEQCIDNELSTDIINPNAASQKSIVDIKKSIQELSNKLEQETIKQNSKIVSLELQIDKLKSQLSSHSTNNISTQKIAKKAYKTKSNLLNDRQLAEILEVAPNTVNRWRTKRRKPSKKHQNIFERYEVVGNRWREI